MNLVRVLVAYDTEYANTKRAAEKIAEGMSEVEGIEIDIRYVKAIDFGKLACYDVMLKERKLRNMEPMIS
jgi:menaquinone-dependent protoporphyrinogen IX oxidase